MSTANHKDCFYLAAFPMPRKVLHQTTDDPPPAHLNHADGRASILIFLSAHAISSVGFAVSLFAIWVGWLLPASTASVVESETKQSRLPQRRRSTTTSAPSRIPPPTPLRRVSAPVDLTPILTLQANEQDHSRHVYFADTGFQPLARRNTMPEHSQTEKSIIAPMGSLTRKSSPATSPLSTSSALPLPDSPDEGNPDSDTSPYSSKGSLQKPPSRLQKLKLSLVKSNRAEVHDGPGDQASITSTETNSSEKSARRASGGFVASWTLSRHRTAPDVLDSTSSSPSPSRKSFYRSRDSPSRPPPVTTTSCPAELLSPTFLSRKSQKRTSAPIPRTSPYGAPYFAAPPTLEDYKYPSYLKTLPQFEDEIQAASAPTSDTDDNEFSRGRTQSIRRVRLYDPPRPVPKRRSASEDWRPRQDTHS